MQKTLFYILIIITLTSCGTPKYYLLDTKQNNIKFNNFNSSLGIHNIKIPSYLQGNNIAKKDNINMILYSKEHLWAEKLDIALQRNLMNYLQDRFKNSNISSYPYDTPKLPDINIKLEIVEFMSDGKYINLEANYKIYNKHSDKIIVKKYTTKISHNDKYLNIVKQMNFVLKKLFDNISRSIYAKAN